MSLICLVIWILVFISIFFKQIEVSRIVFGCAVLICVIHFIENYLTALSE